MRKEQESTEVHETLLGKSLLVYKNGGLSKYTKEMTADFHIVCFKDQAAVVQESIGVKKEKFGAMIGEK